MKHYFLAGALAALLAAGCGSGSSSSPTGPPGGGTQQSASSSIVDPAFSRFDVPAAPANPTTQTYANPTYGFSIQFLDKDFQLYTTPQYVTILGNRIFELVSRTLPAGSQFRPNVGLIVDSQFQGRQIDITGYANSAPEVLGAYFQNFQVVSQTPLTISGHQAVALEYTATWRATDGTLVPFRRITVFTENQGNVLIFTFTAPPELFEASRATFQSMILTIALTS